MKRLCFFLIIIFILSPLLSACEEKEDKGTSEVENHITSIDKFYSAKKLVCWQDIAAIYLAKIDIKKYDYSKALIEPQNLIEKAGMVISVSLLNRQGNDMSEYNINSYITEVKDAVENKYKDLTIKELAMCFYAMTASKTDFGYELAAKSLESRQNNDGGFSASDEYTLSDTESSAYALNIIMLSRHFITDFCYDSVLVYLSNSITDINTLKDIEGKDSSTATAMTLTSMIAANLPLDGEVSTALIKAIDTNFKYQNDSVLFGYRKYTDDVDIDRQATGEVMLCFATTAFGNLWTNLANENKNNDNTN